jgi:serine/threonine-protein kinase
MARSTMAFGLAVLTAAGLPLGAVSLPRFRSDSVWNRNIAAAPLHPQSAAMISTLTGLGGFGFGRMQIDFGMHVVRAAAGAPTYPILDRGGYYLPDCEPLGALVPVPPGAAIEGQTGMTCPASEDCHYLVVQGSTVYEVYRGDLLASGLQAQCLAVWRLFTPYPPEGRGEHCTSADAAGFPMAPLLFNADEIAASLAQDATGGGDLRHALRFILPNPRMATTEPGGGGTPVYVRPASHAGGPTGPSTTVPYGSRLRLRASFPLAGYNPAARVILNTMKRYGIVLADGGNIALTAESDRYTTTTWASLGIDSRVFDLTPGATDVTAADFEVIDTSAVIVETYDCVRTAPPTDVTFADGFE